MKKMNKFRKIHVKSRLIFILATVTYNFRSESFIDITFAVSKYLTYVILELNLLTKAPEAKSTLNSELFSKAIQRYSRFIDRLKD